MATPSYYMVYISQRKDTSADSLEKTMNQSYDWYCIDETLWILYTTSDHEKWYSRLKPLCNYVFICKLDITQRQGWMKTSFWQWLRREKRKIGK
jgi:hypothetical protein